MPLVVVKLGSHGVEQLFDDGGWMPGIVDPLDWERGQRDAKVRELEARIEAATDPEERRDLQRQLREARSDFTRKTIRQRLRDVFLPW